MDLQRKLKESIAFIKEAKSKQRVFSAGVDVLVSYQDLPEKMRKKVKLPRELQELYNRI